MNPAQMRWREPRWLCALCVSGVLLAAAAAKLAGFPRPYKDHMDLVYATAGGHTLALDIRVPKASDGPLPLVVWIHGGAWRGGSREDFGQAGFLAERGFAVASISYRLSKEATWPAQIEDCKAAIRWLRAHAGEYNIDPARIGMWGMSAGGHLAAMVGTSVGVETFEVGDHRDQSSAAQAICDWFGPTDFFRMNDIPGSIDHGAPGSPEADLLGGTIEEMQAEAESANPIAYVDGDEPPFLIMHGEKDDVVIYPQSELLHGALEAAGVPSRLYIVKGGGHGFHGATEDSQEDLREMVVDFFAETLGN